MTTHDKPLMLTFNRFGNSGENLLPKTYELDLDSHGE